MTFVAFHTFPGNTWPPVPDGAIADVWAAYLQLDRTQWLPPEAIESGQLAQVRTLLAHAVHSVPDYRGLASANIHTLADFRRLPLLPAPLPDLSADFADGSSLRDRWHAALALRAHEWRGGDVHGPAPSPAPDSLFSAAAGCLASPCPAGHGLHVHAESVLLEVLDEQGRPCTPGQKGRVVVTALQDFLRPLIRHDTGTTATVGPLRCPCGRGLPLLAFPDRPTIDLPPPPLVRPVEQRRASPAPYFRVRTVAGSTWPGLPTHEASQTWAAYLELGRTQWLDRPALEGGQLSQLRTLLAHCRQHVPWYRRQLTAHGIEPEAIRSLDEYSRLPLLTRRTYQEHFAEFVAETQPPGTQRTDKGFTSGSSGVPVEVWQSNVVGLWWLACYLRDAEWCQVQQHGTLASIRATGKSGEELQRLLAGTRSPVWHSGVDRVVGTGASFSMDIHQEPRRQMEWLLRVRPEYLLSFPSNLEHIAGLLRERGERPPGLRAVLSFAETLTDEAQARIEAGFGVPVRNTYSCVEAGYLASPCPEGHGLHVHAENVLLEVLDEQGRPCGPGATGRVVLTTLHNFLTPLLRYEILDEATVGPERCPCGRGLPLLSRVLGRRHPLLTLPDGSRKICTALVVGMRGLDACHQYQIVQRSPDHVVIRVVPNARWTAAHPERVTQMVRAFMEAPVRVDIETAPALPLPPGGKLPVVVCEEGGAA